MITTQETGAALQTAVLNYFAGERLEMLVILSVSAVLSALTIGLHMFAHTGLSKGFMVTVLLCAALISMAALSLIVRDRYTPAELSAAIRSERVSDAVQSERDRIRVVISKYRYYRYGVAVLGLLAMGGLLVSTQGGTHGICAALLMFVVAQVLIDHFSEHRARAYLDQLMSVPPP